MNKHLSLNRFDRIILPILLILATALLVQTVRGASTAVSVSATLSDQLGNDVDNDGNIDPGDTISYTVVIHNSGDMDATNVTFTDAVDANTTLLAGSINVSPLARADSYMTVGNTLLQVCGTQTETTAVFDMTLLTANDNEYSGDTFNVSAMDAASANGGTVTNDGNGCFRYLPPVNFTGNDTFTYRVTEANSAGQTDTATVTITVAEMVWYVDVGASAGGDGRSSSPFNTLAVAQTASADNHTIYLFEGSYPQSIVLKAGQSLLGEGVALNLAGKAIRAAGNRPIIENSSNSILIQVVNNNTIRGLNTGDHPNQGGAIVVANNLFGTLTVDTVAIAGAGRGIFLQGSGTMDITLDHIASSADANGIRIVANGGSIDGAFTVNGTTTITDTIANGVYIGNTSADFDFGETTSTTSSAVTSNAIILDTNVGASFHFESLNISAIGQGLRANNSGTITVAGANNTATAANSPAVSLVNTTIGAGGVTFESVSTDGGAYGIILNNTGSGSFTVTGAGTTDGSGGTIQNTTLRGIELVNAQNVTLNNMSLTDAATLQSAATGSATCQAGFNTDCNAPLYMRDVMTVALTNVDITGSAQHGINGNNVNGLTISNSNILDAGNEANEHGAHFVNLLGTVNFSNVAFSNHCMHGILVENRAGTLDWTISNSDFDNVHTAANSGTAVTGYNDACSSAIGGAAGIQIVSGDGSQTNTATRTTLNITDSDFTNNLAFGLHVDAYDISTLDVTVTGNRFNGDRELSGLQSAVWIETRQNALSDLTISNNPIGKFSGYGIYVSASDAGSVTARINGNTIDDAKTGSGILLQAVAGSTATDNPSIVAQVISNTVTLDTTTSVGSNLAGIHMQASDAGGGSAGAASIDVTLDDNEVTTDGHDSAIQLYLLDNTGNNRACVNLTNNDPVDGINGLYGDNDLYYDNGHGNAAISGTAIWQGWTGVALDTWNNGGNNAIGNHVNTQGVIQDGTCATVTSRRAALAETIAERRAESAAFMATLAQENTVAADEPINVTVRLAEPVVVSAPQPQAATTTQAAPQSAETINLPIGTLPAGKTITVTFGVTVDEPFPTGVTQVSNQATISGDNFANVLTDDPDTGAAADPTNTPVESCAPFPLSVGTEVELNDAISCYNGVTASGDYAITLSADILLTANTTTISNSTADVALVIDGAGFTIDGQTTVRSGFIINNNTEVTLNTIDLINGSSADFGGAIDSYGQLTIVDSTLRNNTAAVAGGAIRTRNTGATVTIIRSTLSDNSIDGARGGALYSEDNAQSVAVINSTISGNVSNSGGGGFFILDTGSFTLTNSTVVSNTATSFGGGFAIGNTPSFSLVNNIIAGNQAGGLADCSGTTTVSSNNVYGVNGDAGGCTPTASDIVPNGPISSVVLPLANYGGSTATHALAFSSEAVDRANSVDCPATDQRGEDRPIGFGCDIGAFEMTYSDSNNVLRDDFVLGEPRSFGPTLVQITTTAGTLPSSHVTKTQATPPGLVGQPIEVFWDATTHATTFSVDVKFCYTEAELAASTAVTDENVLRLYRSESGGGPWLLVATSTVDTAANCVSATGVTQFSQWAIAELGATDVALQAVRVVAPSHALLLLGLLLTLLTGWQMRIRHALSGAKPK